MKTLRRFRASMLVGVLAGVLAAPALAARPPLGGEDCSHTTLSILPPPACMGSFIGELTGSQNELDLLKSAWNLDFTYLGRSDQPDHGPFLGNPQVAFGGSLAFDEPHSGLFVLGLGSAGKHSYYLINTKRRIGGLLFDSLEGVATTPQGNPFPLDYAALYVATVSPPVPEPETALLLVAGLGALAWRRKRQSA